MVIVNNTHQFCLSLLNIAKSNTLKATTQIHALTCKTCLDQCHLIAGKLLLRYAVELPDDGALDHARRLLAHFPNPDSFMYNTLLRGFSDDPLRAFDIFKQLHRREASAFDSFTFSFAFKAAANLGALSVGSQLHCRALVHGLDTHLFVGTTMVSFYGECGELEFARKAFDDMSERNVIAWNAILTAYFRCGDVRGGEAVFERMPERDLTSWDVVLAGYVRAGEIELARKMFLAMPVKDDVSWSTMIVGFAQNGCYDDAFRLFMDLCCAGERPNEASLSGVLSASAQAGAFQFTRIVHGLVEKSGFLWMVSVNNALLDAYSKCGIISMAQMVFESMSKKSLVSWTSMIAALAMHGHGEEAIRVLHEMEGFGIEPDGITYISILYACSHAGLIEEAEFYFSKMVEQGIEPNIEHYGCMVDIYGRAGKLKKAYTFASQMPVSPNAVIWRTLLGACSLHRNAKLAEQVKQKLSSLDPANSGDHVLLSNVYAVNKRWESVASVRRSMSEQRIRKTPGWSAIEVNNFLHSFMAGDKDNEAHEKLKEVMSRLRVEGGYVAEVGSVLHDIEEEEKEDSLTSHSEKLAVAFGMARLRKGEVIRVVKNLRICRDCHYVMKLISKVYGLEIVVRDRSRFHSFRGGFCSCGDYW